MVAPVRLLAGRGTVAHRTTTTTLHQVLVSLKYQKVSEALTQLYNLNDIVCI
jgi:hypothetical protein